MYDFSFIVATRNDNHGGNMREKNIFFINRWLYHVKKYNLNCELIIVDWNSKIPLRKLIKLALFKKNQIIKIIEVSNKIHNKFKNSKKINFFQMIAKNVGARRANGKFLIFTNIDIIFSEKFLKFLKEKIIKHKIIYRADRHDIDLKELKNYKILEDEIEKKTTHINTKDYVYDIKKNKKIYLRKTFFYLLTLLIRSINSSIFNSFWHKYKIMNVFKKKTLLLIKMFNMNYIRILFDKKLHTNACGDFMMIDKKSFFKMYGYNEFDGFSWHIDSLFLFKAYYYFKLNFIDLKFPVYHINHEPGKNYSKNKKISFKKIESIKLDFISDQKLFTYIKDYRLKKLHKDDKRKDWGLAKEKLSVYKI